jgi:hypothetical protein
MSQSNGLAKRNVQVMDLITANQIERMMSLNNSSRSQLWGRGPFGLGDDNLDWRRNINEQCGFPDTGEMTPFKYRNLFDREAVANRVVSILPKSCWAMQPSIYEDEDAKTKTPFEQSWEDCCKGLRSDNYFQDEEGNPIFEHLMRADILSGIGSFGIILLGFSDGLGLEQPVKGYMPVSDTVPLGTDAQYLGIELNPPVVPEVTPQGDGAVPAEEDAESIASLDDEIDPIAGGDPEVKTQGIKLLFMRSYDESLVQITQFEADKNNPRFGQPVMYRITLNDPRVVHSGVGLPLATVLVHWTRIIHLADNLVSSEVFGTPRQQPVLNNIINIQKLSGAGPEAAWLGAFMTLKYESQPQMGGDIEIDEEGIRETSENLFNSSQRYVVGKGLTIGTITPQVVDLSPQITSQITLICIQLDVPMRLFMGSEQGELASGQDDGNWNSTLKARQQTYLTPRVVCPLIDRLITVGVLSKPKVGYSVKWPELETVDPKDAAAVATAVTNAIASYVSGGCDVLIGPMDFLTHILGPNLGLDEEVVDEIMKNALKHLQEANPNVDAEDIVHGREPQPEVDPNSAAGMAAGGVPMPPMVPGDDGPEPYVDPNKANQSPRSKTGKTSVKNELAAFMSCVRNYNTTMNAHDVSGEARDDHGRWSGGSSVGSTSKYRGGFEHIERVKAVSDAKLSKQQQAREEVPKILARVEHYKRNNPGVTFVPHPKRIANDAEAVHRWYDDQRIAYVQLDAAAHEASTMLALKVKKWQSDTDREHKQATDKEHTDRAINLSKKFLDAAFAEYGKRANKIVADAEKKALNTLAPMPKRGKEAEEKVLVTGYAGKNRTPISQQIAKSKVSGYVLSQKLSDHTVTSINPSLSQQGVPDSGEFKKAKKELRRHLAQHAIAVLAAGWVGTKAVGKDAAEKAVAKSAEWVFQHGVRILASKLAANEEYDLSPPITNEEYNDLSKQEKLITNYALILYPYMLDYVLTNANPNHDEQGRFAQAEQAMAHSQHAQESEKTEGAWDSSQLHEKAATEHDKASLAASHPSQQEFHAQVAEAHRTRAKHLRNAYRLGTIKHVGSSALQGMNETYDGQDPLDAAIGVGKGLIRGIFNEENELIGVENYDRDDVNTEDSNATDI